MLYNISKSLYICVTMKAKTYIPRTFSLSCLLAGALAFFALNALANNSLPSDNNKDKTKKAADSQHFVLNTAMPKTNLSLDAAYRYSGTFSSDFKFNTSNTTNNTNNVINLKAVMTYTKGNVTYVVPSNYQVQTQPPGNMNFQKLQIILPLKKG